MREQLEKKKPSKLRDDHHDPMVGCMVQNNEMATQWLRLLKIETQHKTAPKSLQLGLREFRRISLCVTCFCFYKKGKYSKVLNGDIPGTSTAPTCGRPGHQVMRRSMDICVFKIQLTNTIKLVWQVTEDFIVNGSTEKSCEQLSALENNVNRNCIQEVTEAAVQRCKAILLKSHFGVGVLL